jgi:hypothetical protein
MDRSEMPLHIVMWGLIKIRNLSTFLEGNVFVKRPNFLVKLDNFQNLNLVFLMINYPVSYNSVKNFWFQLDQNKCRYFS